jgi:two-component system LytT family response regulator
MERAKKKIRTLIVDDEPLARQNLRLLLQADPDVEIIDECGSGREAVEAIEARAIDLLFLDIQMPEMNGFDVLARIDTARIPAIIFVTAFDRYALKAFEVHALDYLLKPFDDARFEKALRQAKAQIEQREINHLSRKLFALLEDREAARLPEPARAEYLTRMMIKSAGRVLFLKVDEIDWIGADDYYVKLHAGRKIHLLRETMNEIETKLDPEKFLRIHRSTIVNIDRIKELHPHFNGDYAVVLHDGTELKLSRSRREQVRARLKTGGAKLA